MDFGEGELHDGRTPVDVVIRQFRGEEPVEQLIHLRLREPLTRLDCSLAGEGEGESLVLIQYDSAAGHFNEITGEDYIPRVTDGGEYHVRYAGTEFLVYSEYGVHKLCRGVRGVHSRAENTITICEGERVSDYLQRIVTHELLHSFGLGHEHGDTESVMNDNGRFRHVEFPTDHDYAQLDALK